MAQENYYQILGLTMRATAAEIKAAYKKKALQFHPDRNQGSKFHEEHFKLILEAYQTLSNPSERDRYDLKLFYGAFNQKQEAPVPPRAYGSASEYAAAANRYNKRSNTSETNAPEKKSQYKLHSFVIALLIMASAVMFFYWIGQLMNRSQAEKALEEGRIAEAVAYDDTYAPADFAMGMLLRDEDRNPRQAIAFFDKAIQHAEHQTANYYYERSICHVRLSNYTKAISDLEWVIKLSPNNDTAWYALADLQLYVLEKPSEALKGFSQVLKNQPKAYNALFGKGCALLKLENFAAADTSFGLAALENRENPNLFYYWGFAKIGLNDTLSACLLWNEAQYKGISPDKIPRNIPCVDILRKQQK